MRIAVIGPSRYPVTQPFAGGLEALVWHLVHGLRSRGHHVTLFAAEGSDGGDPELSFPAARWHPSATAAGDVSMPAPDFIGEHHAHLDLMLALGGRLRHRFDVVHNHSLHYLPLAMAQTLPQPVLTTLHTPPTPWLESAVAAAGQRGSSSFSAVSGFLARQWESLLGPVDVVPNGVDCRVWRPGPGGDDLAWSGRIVPEKAPHLAIEAAHRAGRRLVLAGPVQDQGYFDDRVRPALGPDIAYAGHLTSAELSTLVGSSATALVTPVWDEPFGLVVAEALACGTPVVAFRRGGVPEVLSSPLLGELVPPGDPVAMGEAVDRVARLDRGLVRSCAEARLSRSAMVSGYEQLYRRQLSASTARESLLA
ncbi:glycosyltransferase family 4 protein [Dermatophilaceae bacterium Soc4.6]